MATHWQHTMAVSIFTEAAEIADGGGVRGVRDDTYGRDQHVQRGGFRYGDTGLHALRRGYLTSHLRAWGTTDPAGRTGEHTKKVGGRV